VSKNGCPKSYLLITNQRGVVEYIYRDQYLSKYFFLILLIALGDFYMRVYRVVYNMTSHKEDTEDIVQTAFIKAYQSLPKFKAQARFYTWLYRIALNVCLNALKKRKKHMAWSLEDVDAGVERNEAYVELSNKMPPHRVVNLSEIQEKLNAALQKLSKKHRSVVVLHDIEGLRHEEIAKILHISSGTVRSRLHYARAQLQIELAEFAGS